MQDDSTLRDAGGSAPARPSSADLARGTTLDRYVLLAKLGQGGMGVVYAAYDPKLDRKIALKLVRRGTRTATQRLELEAQALARLNHENVVTVYDVGSVDGQVFIAMEFVEGITVTQWVHMEARPWREVLEVYQHAGRGLAAAHEAGLVHRDFKPDNVMISAKGRVVVMDFGIAKLVADDEPSTIDVVLPDIAVSRPQMTQTGALVGTPMYMAAEQHRGESDLDGRTDQFAFCVSLYEALYGERPFAGATWADVAYAVFEGEIREAPKGTLVPAWVRRVVVQGLQRKREARFPSMDALLAELERDPARTRRRWLIGTSIGVTAIAGVAAVAYVAAHAHHPDPCGDGAARLAESWGPVQRGAIRQALLSTTKPFAVTSWQSADRALETYAQRWRDSYRDVCEATWVHHEQSNDLLDLRMSCLDDRRSELSALATLLAKADAKALDHAAAASEELPPPERCTQVTGTKVVHAPAQREEVERRRAKVSETVALELLGDYRGALKLAKSSLDEARAMSHPFDRASMLASFGHILIESNDPDAEATLFEAAASAEEAGDDVLASSAWQYLIRVVGNDLHRTADSERYARLAAASLARAGNPPRSARELANDMGLLHLQKGELVDAEKEYRHAIELFDQDPGSDPKQRLNAAMYMNNLGVALTKQGKTAEGLTFYQQALEIRERLEGADHPEVALTLGNIASIYEGQGRYREAETQNQRAFAIYEKVYGHESLQVARALDGLGRDALNLGRPDEAIARYEQAVAIAEKIHVPDQRMAVFANSLASAHRALGHLEPARAGFARAKALLPADKKAVQPFYAKVRSSLCSTLSAQGRHDEALVEGAAALALAHDVIGPDDDDLAQIQTAYGEALVAAGKPADALAILEPALERRERGDGEPPDLANTRFAVAEALRALNRDPARARRLGEQARDTYQPLKASYPFQLARIESWLAAAR